MMATLVKRRNHYDVAVEILNTARTDRIRTHIMYKAKLSYSQIIEYLYLLVTKGFLEKYDSYAERKDAKNVSNNAERIRILKSFFGSYRQILNVEMKEKKQIRGVI